MRVRTQFAAMTKHLVAFAMALCLVGAAAAMYVVVVRVPALAGTKFDLLVGTLLGVAVALLFGIATLLIALTHTRFAGRTIRRPSPRSAMERIPYGPPV